MNGKLNLEIGVPLYAPCHNDFTKKVCDNCMQCKSPQCAGAYCDVHHNCQCERTACICLGR